MRKCDHEIMRMVPLSFDVRFHFSMSHWAFVLMGVHLGLHIPAMVSGLKLKKKTSTILGILFEIISVFGLYLFFVNGIPAYLLFRNHFAFSVSEKRAVSVFLENLIILVFWAFIGTRAEKLCHTKR